MGAMGRTRLTSRALRLTLGFSAGERSGLAPAGTLRCFQFLAQPLVFLFEPLILLFQLLNLSPGPVALFPRTA